eukprot:scaffold114158_cov97-Cyclotella_meneghiniana.AAC.1
MPSPPNLDSGIPATAKGRTLFALLAITTSALIVPAHAQTCHLPEGFNSYFQNSLDDIESTLTSCIVNGLDEIGIGPLSGLSVNDLLNFNDDVFQPLFGDAVERDAWINVTSAVDVGARLSDRSDDAIRAIPPVLAVTCQLEITDDLAEDESPYRLAVEIVVSGSIGESM